MNQKCLNISECTLKKRRLNQYQLLCWIHFCGSGTTAMVANKLGRSFKGCDLNPANVEMSYERVRLGK